MFANFWETCSTLWEKDSLVLVAPTPDQEDTLIDTLLDGYVNFKKDYSVLVQNREALLFKESLRSVLLRVYRRVASLVKLYCSLISEYFELVFDLKDSNPQSDYQSVNTLIRQSSQGIQDLVRSHPPYQQYNLKNQLFKEVSLGEGKASNTTTMEEREEIGQPSIHKMSIEPREEASSVFDRKPPNLLSMLEAKSDADFSNILPFSEDSFSQEIGEAVGGSIKVDERDYYTPKDVPERKVVYRKMSKSDFSSSFVDNFAKNLDYNKENIRQQPRQEKAASSNMILGYNEHHNMNINNPKYSKGKVSQSKHSTRNRSTRRKSRSRNPSTKQTKKTPKLPKSKGRVPRTNKSDHSLPVGNLHHINDFEADISNISSINKLYIPQSKNSKLKQYRGRRVLSKVDSFRKKSRSRTPTPKDCVKRQLSNAQIQPFSVVMQNLEHARKESKNRSYSRAKQFNQYNYF